MLANKEQIETVANDVLEEKEIYGDDLIRLLDEQHFMRPEIDWTDEAVWPKFMNWSKSTPSRVDEIARPTGQSRTHERDRRRHRSIRET